MRTLSPCQDELISLHIVPKVVNALQDKQGTVAGAAVMCLQKVTAAYAGAAEFMKLDVSSRLPARRRRPVRVVLLLPPARPQAPPACAWCYRCLLLAGALCRLPSPFPCTTGCSKAALAHLHSCIADQSLAC